jgi:hypothetical protein
MGHGSYSIVNASNNGLTRSVLTNAQVFTERKINNAMNPYGVTLRESRDSEDHPNSFPVVLGLDLTGSMGSIPNFLVKQGLPMIMEKIFKGGEKDPQILFVGVGDHECDGSPLQVGQFESNDEALDKWLTSVFLEGGGGGNGGESYSLAWYFAAYHTSTDSFEKRGRKGLLFTIGDEPVLPTLNKNYLTTIMGPGQYEDFTSSQLLEKAREKFDIYHIHCKYTGTGSAKSVANGWKELMGQNLIIVNQSEEIVQAISDTVLKHKNTATTVAESVEDEDIL